MEHTIPTLAQELGIPRSTLYSAVAVELERAYDDTWARRESATVLIDSVHPRFQAWLSRYQQGRHGPRIVPETPKQRWNQDYWQRRRARQTGQNEFLQSAKTGSKTS